MSSARLYALAADNPDFAYEAASACFWVLLSIRAELRARGTL